MTPHHSIPPTSPAPYGPRTPRVRHFLQRLAAQPAIVWMAAARHYDASRDDPGVRRADRALGQAVDAHARLRERDALVGPVVQMARRAVPAPADGREDEDTIERVAEPALAAALALLAEDILSGEHVRALYAPFASVIPLDELPEIDADHDAGHDAGGSTPAPD